MKYSAVILAAGSSTRFVGPVNKLLYVLPEGLTVLQKAMKLFREDEDCQQVIVVCSPDSYVTATENPDWKTTFVLGGERRSDSVFNGLTAVNQEVVLIHDAARCYLEKEDLERLKKALKTHRAAILVQSSTDTMKQVDAKGHIIATIDRNTLKKAQTPQGFRFADIYAASRQAAEDGFAATDDAQILEYYTDIKILCVEALHHNSKITTRDDIRGEK